MPRIMELIPETSGIIKFFLLGQARGMQFQPVDSTIVYPLYYNMNGGTGGPKQRN